MSLNRTAFLAIGRFFYDMDSRSVNNILQSFTFDSSMYQSELATMQNVYLSSTESPCAWALWTLPPVWMSISR